MIAVIFEVTPTESGKQEYLDIAADLKKHLSNMNGFVSIERFQSLSDKSKILSLSFWDSEESITQWRNLEKHRIAQKKGRDSLFDNYRIRVAQVTRDYTLENHSQAPRDSREVHEK